MTASKGAAANSATIPLALTIQSLPSGRYRLTVTDSPGGSTSVDIAGPFSMTSLGQLADALEGRVKVSAEERDNIVKQFGEKLFQSIFTGALADVYAKYRQQAINASLPLTIHVNLDKAGLLANVPWNLLRDPAVGLLPVVISDPPDLPQRVGGAREVIVRPRTVAIIVPLLVIIVLAGFGIRQLNAPPTDVDLTITSLRFFPRQPAPGDLVTISMSIHNSGTFDAGHFKWAWYETSPQAQSAPNMIGDVPALPGGATITVKNDFIFGWWGLYNTTAWVNFDNKQPETNSLNNFSTGDQGQVTTSNKPFSIDWTRMPDASPITASLDLAGSEFSDWGLTIKTDASSNSACLKTIPRLIVNNEASLNQLMLSLPGGDPLPATCAMLPLSFTLTHPFGSASLDFTTQTPGDYTMVVLDNGGKTLGTATVTAKTADTLNLHVGAGPDVADPQTMQPLSVSVHAFQIVVQGPGQIMVQRLTLGKPTG